MVATPILTSGSSNSFLQTQSTRMEITMSSTLEGAAFGAIISAPAAIIKFISEPEITSGILLITGCTIFGALVGKLIELYQRNERR